MKTRDERAFWQRAAKFYARSAEGSDEDFYREMCDRIKAYLQPTMSVLELACGSGQLSFTLAPYVHDWLATDFAPAMVDAGRKRLEQLKRVDNQNDRQFSEKKNADDEQQIGGFDSLSAAHESFSANQHAGYGESGQSLHVGNLRFQQQDATALNYDDGQFDAVVIANALQVMPHPEQALSEIHRVLKPGGYLFAPTFVGDETAHPAWRFKLLKPFGFRLYQTWSVASFVEFVSSRGFTIVESPLFGTKNLPICGLVARS